MCKRLYRVSILALFTLLLLNTTSPAGAISTNLKVAFKCDMPIYQFIDENGQLAGIHIDILNEIAAEDEFTIEYVPMKDMMDCIYALEMGDVDVVLGMPKVTGKDFLTSLEISNADLYMLASKSFLNGRSIDDLKDYTLVFEYNTTNYSVISNMNASVYRVVRNQMEVLKTQMQGEAEVMICDENCMPYLLEKQGIQDQYTIIHSYVNTVGYTMAVQKGNNRLLRILNDGIVNLRVSGKYEKIRRKWIPEEVLYDVQKLFKIIIIISVVLGIAIAAYVMINNHMKSILKEEVAKKTKELQRTNSRLEQQVMQLKNEGDLRNRIIEHSPNGMIHFDRAFNITIANHSACLLAGVNDIPNGTSVLTLPVFGGILKPRCEDVFSGEYSLSNQVLNLYSEKGPPKSYRCNINRTFEYGEINGALMTVEDVTREEKEKHEMFEKEKNKVLNRLIAGIAHEIKNPLMSIRTFASLIATKKDDRQFQDSFAEFVPREADRINMLVESLINYAKPIKGESELINIKSAIDECMYLTRTAVKRDNICIEVDAEEGLCIEADKNQIKQVLINIIMNGIESMEKKLEIDEKEPEHPLIMNISARSHDSMIYINIRDEGIGMSERELKRCTDPFFTTKVNGTGLGMALSKNYLEENNGELHIESCEHEFTIVTITFRRRQK
jgi:polar amino acid transport system substrate-binding protein